MRRRYTREKLDKWLELDYANIEITKHEAYAWFPDGRKKNVTQLRGYRYARAASLFVIPLTGILLYVLHHWILK